MRKLSAALVAASSALLLTASLALAADPPAAVPSPVGGFEAHFHHVDTPAGCVNVGAVKFEPDGTRGLHGVAFASGGPSQGPWHAPCP